MSSTAKIIAAAWRAWAEWQDEKDDRGGGGAQRTWTAILEMFRLMDKE